MKFFILQLGSCIIVTKQQKYAVRAVRNKLWFNLNKSKREFVESWTAFLHLNWNLFGWFSAHAKPTSIFTWRYLKRAIYYTQVLISFFRSFKIKSKYCWNEKKWLWLKCPWGAMRRTPFSMNLRSFSNPLIMLILYMYIKWKCNCIIRRSINICTLGCT